MKVAICFFGQPRWLNNPYVYMSHKKWIMDLYDTDIFIHSWINNSENNFEYADQVDDIFKNKEVPDSDQIILNRYKPKEYLFEKSKTFYLSKETRDILEERKNLYHRRINGSFNWSENNENNHLSQLYSISKSIELLNNHKYDFVFISRFDNYIYKLPNLYNLNSDALYINDKILYNFSDVLIFGGQEHIKTFNCIDKVDEISKHVHYFSPEEYKRVAYQSKFGYNPPIIGDYGYEIGKEKRIDIGVGVVRSNNLKNLQL